MMVRLSGRFSTFTVIGIQACKLTHSYTVLTGNFLALSAFFRSYSFASNGAFQNRGGGRNVLAHHLDHFPVPQRLLLAEAV